MKNYSKILKLGVFFLIITAFWAKITRARLYDAGSKLKILSQYVDGSTGTFY